MSKNLGHVTAYAYAKEGGYTGTEEEFKEMLANVGSYAEEAEESATTATAAATTATTKATEINNKVDTATSIMARATSIGNQRFIKTINYTNSGTVVTIDFNPTGYSYSSTDRFTVYLDGVKIVDSNITVAQSGEVARLTFSPELSVTADQILEIIADTDVEMETDDTLTMSGAAADAKVTGDEISGLKQDLYQTNSFDVLAYNSTATSGTDKNVTFTFNGNSCAVSGTANGNAVRNIYSNTSQLPYGFVAGRSYSFKYTTGDNNVRLAMFFRDSNNVNISGSSQYLTSDKVVPIPSNAVGMIIRIDVQSNATVNTTVTYNCLSADSNYDLMQKVNRAIKGEVQSYYQTTGLLDLNGMLDDHVWLVDDSHTFINKPDGMTSGFVMVTRTSNFHLQLAWQYNGGKMWKRRGDATGSIWEDWKLVSGDAGTVNNYYFETNENTYNIESTPTITSDTNNYLASTGDTTDRTSDIATMLTANKVCNLGAGVFYVKDLEMPSGTAIKGSGYNTKIIMASGDGCAIQMASFCSISDCSVCGSASSISVPTEIGSRNGILWSGNFTETSDSTAQPMMGLISNVRILDFTGGAIVCQDTGTGTFNQLEVVNVFTNHCGVGIYIPYYSEYHKFTNVRTAGGLYGCINNGGNNIFVNCDFSTCKNGLLMDNSSNQSPNNSHGSMIGCVFNHINSNTGIAIKILNCDHGFVFDGCQIFYGQIDIEDSDGIVISSCNFGQSNNTITIKNGGTVLFTNNMHKAQPTISITNNENVHFVNCYVGSTGASVTPA